MRTTVTLDSDVEQLIRSRMVTLDVSFKTALNDAVRAGAAPRVDLTFTDPVSLGSSQADLTHALRLAGDLEDQERARRMRVAE